MARTTKAGTSATTTRTARNTRVRSTSAATGARQPASPPNAAGKPAEFPLAVAAVRKTLAEVAKRDPDLADSALAAAAFSMAQELDNPANKATAKSYCAKALLELLNRIWELVPPEEEGDIVDDLAEKRRKRLDGGAKAAN